MILRSIAVEGWRCFANRIEVGPFGEGMNIVHGPNGTGKSTLLGALTRGLFDNHTVRGEAAETLRPWGRPLAPTVTIVFEHQGESYSLTKKFLDSAGSELKRKEHGKFVRLAEGDAANRQVREILQGEVPGRGLTKVEHWGLAQVLWAPQNALRLEGLSDGATGAVQAALGAALGEGDAIQRRIEDAYLRIYTDKGKLRRGAGEPAIVGMEERLNEAQAKRSDLAARLVEFEEAGRNVENLKHRSEQAARDAQHLEKKLDEEKRRAAMHAAVRADQQKFSAEARGAEARHSELRQRIENLRAHRQEMTGLEEDLGRRNADLPLHARQVERCRVEEEQKKTRLEAIRSRQGEVTAAADLARDAARFREQHRRLKELDDLLAQVAATQGRIDALREQRAAVVPPDAELIKGVRAARSRRGQLQAQLDASLTAPGLGPDDAAPPCDPPGRLAEIDGLPARIAATQARIDTLRQQRVAVPAPSAETIKAVRAARSRREHLQVQLDASLITLSFTAEATTTIEVLRAEETGPWEAASGESIEIKGSPEVTLRIPGVGDFRATGPTGSAKEIREQLAETEEQIKRLTEGFATDDADELQALHTRAAELDGQIKQAGETLSGLLAKSKKIEELRRAIVEADRQIDKLTEGFATRDPDGLQALHSRAAGLDAEIQQASDALRSLLLKGRKAEDIQKERARTAQAVEEILCRRPEWRETPPDADALEAEAKAVENAFIRDVRQAEEDWGRAVRTTGLASQELARHEAGIQEQQKRLLDLRQRVAALSNDGRDDAQRAAELDRLALEWDTARARLKEVEEKLEEFGGDPGRQVQILEGQLRQRRNEAEECMKRFHTEQGRLQELAAAAPYSALAEVEETIERLQAEIVRERLRIDAIRLLRETIRHHRQVTLEALVEPVRQLATQTLHRIAGPRLGSIQFTASFLPEKVTPRGAEAPVKIEELCGGEQEQLHFAVRLALADVLFRKERQLLVLDDVLTSTDAGRLARVLAVLEDAAARFQVLVLTCHPEKYSGLAGACFFDLERIAAGA